MSQTPSKAPEPPCEMSSSPLQTVQAVYEAFRRRDLPALFNLLSSDIEITQSEELPWGGIYRGHEGAQQFFTKLTSRIDSSVQIERFIQAGQDIAAIGWTQGSVISTGAKFHVAIAHIWRVRAGAVVQVRFLIDNPAMLAALAADAVPQGA